MLLGEIELRNRLTSNKMKLSLLKRNLFQQISKFTIIIDRIKKITNIASNLLPWLEETVSICDLKINTHIYTELMNLQSTLKVL